MSVSPSFTLTLKTVLALASEARARVRRIVRSMWLLLSPAAQYPRSEGDRLPCLRVREIERHGRGLVRDEAAAKRHVRRAGWARASRYTVPVGESCVGAEGVQSDPARAKSLKEIELHIGEKKALLRKASAHDNQYYLVLPKDWSPAKKWPIMVYVEGAGCNFKGAIENWGEQRGDFNCILITPQTFSSTNKLADVKAKFTYDASILEKYESGDRIGFDERLAEADLVVTGEGRLDATSFTGKVVGRVLERAGAMGVETVVLAGEVAAKGGIDAISLVERYGPERALSEPAECLTELVASALAARRNGP